MNKFEQWIARVGSKAERFVSRRFQGERKPETIEPYIGYATADELVVLGRVMSNIIRADVTYDQGRLRNVRQMLGRFMTAEVGGAQVSAEGQTATSDEEGYFELRLPRGSRDGWTEVDVTLEANGSVVPCPVLVASPQADAIVISDIPTCG